MSIQTPKTSPVTVKTRILLLSDTHHLNDTNPDLQSTEVPFHLPLPAATVLIHSGDLTSSGLRSQNELAVNFLRSHPAELKLVIAGNHDVTLDKTFYLKSKPHMAGSEYPEDVDALRSLYTCPEAVADGVRYLDEGVHRFTLKNGASFTVYASPYTPEFCRWAFAYPRSEDRFNCEKWENHPGNSDDRGGGNGDNVNEGLEQSKVPDFPAVDIMLTHGPPMGVLDQVVPPMGFPTASNHVGCEHLWEAVRRAKPRLHVFGHIHEGWGAERWAWNERNAIERLLGPLLLKGSGKGKRVRRWGSDEVTAEEKERWVREGGRYLDMSAESGREEDRVIHGQSTLFVNASIMDVRYRPENAPWIIDIDLPLGGLKT